MESPICQCTYVAHEKGTPPPFILYNLKEKLLRR